jgi:hypothetical protein
MLHFADFLPKINLFSSKSGICGPIWTFQAHYDAQAISKHIVKIFKK